MLQSNVKLSGLQNLSKTNFKKLHGSIGSTGLATVLIKIFFGTTSLGLTTFYKLPRLPSFVECQGRTVGLNEPQLEVETNFPWIEFFKLLSQDILYIIAAVIVSLLF